MSENKFTKGDSDIHEAFSKLLAWANIKDGSPWSSLRDECLIALKKSQQMQDAIDGALDYLGFNENDFSCGEGNIKEACNLLSTAIKKSSQ